MPVLQAPQVGKAESAALIDDGIFVDPSCARCIGANRRMHILWQTPAYLLQVFDDPRARPVEICAVLKNHIDVGVPEHRLRAHGFHMRCGQKAGDDRIGYLVLDHIRGFAGPACMNNHLHIGDIGQCVQRHMLKRPDAGKREQQHGCEDEESVARADFDYFGEHYIPPVAFTRSCFVAITCPFF